MLATADRLWFSARPGRGYRTRSVSRAEAALWRWPPDADRFPWIIVRRLDGAERRYTLPAHTVGLDDTDEELAPIFARLPDPYAGISCTFPPVRGGTLDRIEGRLAALLTASVPFEPDEYPAVAYRDEMRARGQEALALGGVDVLEYLVHRLAEAAPERAEVHAAILEVAWEGMTNA